MSQSIEHRAELQMARKRSLLVVILPLALGLGAGCATGTQTELVWVKDGGSSDELQQAIRECEPYAVPSRHPGRSDRMEAESSAGGFVRCMDEKGWHWETREVSP